MELSSVERNMLGPAIHCEAELQKILQRPTVSVERPNADSISLIETTGEGCVVHAYVGKQVGEYAAALVAKHRRVVYCSLRPGLARLLSRAVKIQRVNEYEWVFTGASLIVEERAKVRRKVPSPILASIQTGRTRATALTRLSPK